MILPFTDRQFGYICLVIMSLIALVFFITRPSAGEPNYVYHNLVWSISVVVVVLFLVIDFIDKIHCKINISFKKSQLDISNGSEK